MKKIIFILIVFTSTFYSQIGYINTEHPVYDYLERMQSHHIIDNYDPFELPLTRKEIVSFINEIKNKKNELSRIDINILNDLLVEFNFDIDFSTKSYQTLFPKLKIREHLNQNEKFIYLYEDSSYFNTFINLVGTIEFLYSRNDAENKNALLFTFGTEVRGSFLNNFGYYFRATNGIQSGDRE